MCGRLVLTSTYREKIKAIFDRVDAEEWRAPRYNVTPGQHIPVLGQDDPDRLTWRNWGHTPPASSTGAKGRFLINARSETVHRLPTFRDAFKARRCVVLADGFYEWHRANKAKPQPYFFERADHAILPIAGLLLPGDEPECVVLTTEANSLMHRIHHRMPVIFSPDTARTWLMQDASPDTLRAVLQPFPSEAMSTHPVSPAVNRASSEGPELIKRVQIVEQTDLF